MTTCRRLGLVFVLLALTVTGCRNVQTTFVNATGQPLELQVVGPGDGVGHLGTLPSHGELRTVIEVRTRSLPATYSVLAGEYKQDFSITKDSKDKITVTIPEDSRQNLPAWRHEEGSKKTGEDAPMVFER